MPEHAYVDGGTCINMLNGGWYKPELVQVKPIMFEQLQWKKYMLEHANKKQGYMLEHAQG